jgi:hypothetical protein
LTVLVIFKYRSKQKQWTIGLLSLVGLTFFALSVYQKLGLGETRYYAIKLAILFSVVTSLLFLAFAKDYIKLKSRSDGITFTAFIVVVALIPLLLGLDPRKSAYPLKNSAPITEQTANIILKAGTRGQQDLVIETPNKRETFLANKLWSSVELYNNKDRKLLLEKLSQQINE